MADTQPVQAVRQEPPPPASNSDAVPSATEPSNSDVPRQSDGNEPNGAARDNVQQKVQVPARPALAPGVKLAGEMHESAFKDPPWLIEREGAGYVQVTELLYRIAEQCDGQHDLEEIATAVSDATGRGVSLDNVKQLVGAQLLLKGLVQTADGKVLQNAGGARSLLAINMRQRMIGADRLDPFARALELLFWPPVLITVVVAALALQAWLYLVHGVARGAHDLLYTPALLLVAIAVTVISAGFHELGHAAALRYGGGQAKGMGVGIYLIYPAFYTDVSDNYRLGRWGRVRTDLGGVYFNLVFILGVIGLYWLTGLEFLLMIVVMLNLEIFRQLQPLVRLDGYWVIADMTGVPDFLSRVGPFVKRLLPIKSKEAEKLPPLKWWGALVFGAYVFIAIPLLIFLIGAMLISVPRLLATGWDSFQHQLMGFSQAQAAGNGLGMTVAIIQALLIGLPMLGALYSVYRMGSRVILGVWVWSQPSAGRKAAAFAGLIALSAVAFHFWGPGLSFTAPDSSAARSSPWTPIQQTDRGTAFDVIGAAPPAWIAPGQPAAEPNDANRLAAVSSPTAESAAVAAPSPEVRPSPEPSLTLVVTSTPTQGAAEKAIPTPIRVVSTAVPTPPVATLAPTEPPATQAVPTVAPSSPTATSTLSPRLGAPSTLPPVAPGAAAPTNTPNIPTPVRPVP